MMKGGNIELGDSLVGEDIEDVEVDESLFNDELGEECLDVSDDSD